MQVTIDEAFTVNAPRKAAWALLSDPESIVTCVPGAQITESTGENTYKGKVSMKVGPVVTNFTGDIRIEKSDEAAGELVLEGSGRDAKGKGSARMRLVGTVRELGDGQTEVSSAMTLSISGRLAQFGSRLMADVSRGVFEKFVECFRARLVSAAAEHEAAAPANAFGLLLGAMKRFCQRLFQGKAYAGDDRE